MRISMVVAAADNNAIGVDNRLLWHLPNDLKHFKNTTWALPVIMGRKTLEALSGKPLNGRMNILMTRQKDFSAEGFHVVHDMNAALDLVKSSQYREVNIIGGGEIYRQFLPLAHRIILTRVEASFTADAFFPELPADEWQLLSDDPQPADERHAYSYRFQVWERNKPVE
jgi:dihydrofolate reductase